MKILFVLGNVFPNDDANSNIIWSLVNVMRLQGNVCDVLGKKEENDTDLLRPGNLYYYELKELNNINCYYNLKKHFIKKLLFLFAHPKTLNFRYKMNLSNSFVNEKFEIECKKQIEKLCEKNKYDVVISVSMPIYTSLALAKAKIDAKKVEYRLDPFAFNILENTKSFMEKIEIEKTILKYIDCAFFTKLDYSDMLKCDALTEYHCKMSFLEFPAIKGHKTYECTLSKSIKNNGLSFAFIGYLYKDIRNPAYVLEFFSRLLIDIDFTLYFIGGGCEDILNNYKKIMGEHLIVIKKVSAENAYAVMESADFLINIGNTILNMVPSKIFDYFSTGSPIINFVKSRNCPTLDYMKLYKNSISVIDYEWEKNYINLKNFCGKNHEKISLNEIKEIFNNNTPEFVAEKMIKELSFN